MRGVGIRRHLRESAAGAFAPVRGQLRARRRWASRAGSATYVAGGQLGRGLTRYADLWSLRRTTSTTASTNSMPTRSPPAKPASATMSVIDGPTR